MNGLMADIGRDLKAANAKLDAVTKQRDQLRAIARGVLIALEYPRGSEAQVRCLEEVGADAKRVLAEVQPEGGK